MHPINAQVLAEMWDEDCNRAGREHVQTTGHATGLVSDARGHVRFCRTCAWHVTDVRDPQLAGAWVAICVRCGARVHAGEEWYLLDPCPFCHADYAIVALRSAQRASQMQADAEAAAGTAEAGPQALAFEMKLALPPALVLKLDRARAGQSRSEWIVALVERALGGYK